MLEPMSTKMFNSIILLDGICYNKENNIRTIDNISSLYNNNPKGCFVVQENNRVVGYIFSRAEGNLGFIGPLAVHPEYRNKDYAQDLIKVTVQSLINMGCKSIGTDLNPITSENLGLFLSAGFELSYPTILYKKTFPYPNISSEHILNGNEVTDEMLFAFDRKFREDFNGYSLIKDLKEALSLSKEKVIFYLEDDCIKGFVFNIKEISPYVCAGFLKEDFVIGKFLHAYGCLQNICTGEQMLLSVNSKYRHSDELIKYGFKVQESYTRMLYKEFEGRFNLKEDNGLIARSWMQ